MEKKSDGKAKSKMEELLQKKGERSIQCKDSTAISSKVIIDNFMSFLLALYCLSFKAGFLTKSHEKIWPKCGRKASKIWSNELSGMSFQ